MTKKDIDNIIKTICPNDEDFEKTIISPTYLKKELETLALEQEPDLGKIRAEIESLEDGISSYHNDRPWIYKDEVLAIIDKYKAERMTDKNA